jgi:16S rRNA (cytosine1402-N4)-methyltransferase
MDIGVSSMQLDEAERGFSFTKQARLDMRMNQNQPLTAETIINSYSEKDLADAIFIYGDEKKSRIIAKKIVEARRAKKIESTTELADIIKKAVGSYNDSIHPATRTFQAIRILVNNELEELKLALENAVSVLKNGGKLLVITFHSGEDEIVKKYFNSLTKVVSSSRYDPFVNNSLTKIDNNFINLTKKVVMASEEEIKENPRARSAKLRVIQKINGGKE